MFARKHVSVIPVGIVPWLQLSQKKESIAGRSMAVRAAPRNAMRDKTGKKAVRPAPLSWFERFVAPLSVLSDIDLPIRPA